MELSAEGIYELRQKDVLFPNTSVLSLFSNNKYYGYDASTHPENMDRIGLIQREPIEVDPNKSCFQRFWGTFFLPCTCFDTWPAPPDDFYKLSEDPVTARARSNRIQAFQSSANDIIKVVPTDLTTHVNDDIIDLDNDEIIASISATEILNFPATTDDNITLRGSIQVSLVRSKQGHKPSLMFSINQGTVSIRVHEFFTYLQGLCCGIHCRDIGGSFGALYQVSSVVSNQFYSLDLEKSSTINVTASRSLGRSVTAKSGNIDKPCYLYCINCAACCIQIGMCQICSDCPCFQWNKLFNDSFEAEDKYVLGTEPPLNSKQSFIANTVDWKLETDGNQANYLTFTYKTQKGTFRQCRLKLACNQTFEDAKRFSILMRSVIN